MEKVMSLTSAAACQQFLSIEAPKTIASRLRHDQELFREGRLPSILALYIPPVSSRDGDKIAACFSPTIGCVDGARDLRRLRYSGVVQGIKAHLAQMEHDIPSLHSDRDSVELKTDSLNASLLEDSSGVGRKPAPAHQDNSLSSPEDLRATQPLFTPNESPTYDVEEPSGEYANVLATAELQSTLHVLRRLQLNGTLSEEATYVDISRAVEALLSLKQGARITSRSTKPKVRKCYICRFIIPEPHPQYSSLCRPCGDFNLYEAGRSLPQKLNLQGKTAVITGGRVNLGFHTALRLLRCGASVIVSSRYPRDAELRYHEQSDSSTWSDRLGVVGADFRRAKDVFRFVGSINEILQEWDGDNSGRSHGKLDILINNAAQTLTDPIAAETKAIQNEMKIQRLLGDTSSVVANGYEATIRGGSQMLGGLIEAQGMATVDTNEPYTQRF